MAYLDEEEQKKQPTDGSGTGESGGGSFAGGTTGAAGASGGGAAQAGTGGKGLFSNIQSYLGANQGSSGVKQFNQANQGNADEYNNFQTKATNYDTNLGKGYRDAKSVIRTGNSGIEGARNFWEQSNPEFRVLSGGDAAPYSATSAFDPYKQSAYAASEYKYTNPEQFQYSAPNDVTQFGGQLGDDKSFRGLMGNLYGKQLGGFSPGQGLLQEQLDAVSPELAGARSTAKSQFDAYKTNSAKTVGDLNAKRDQYNTEVTGKLGNLKSDYDNFVNSTTGYENKLRDMTNYRMDGLGAQEIYGGGSGDLKQNAVNNFNQLRQQFGLGEYQPGQLENWWALQERQPKPKNGNDLGYQDNF